MPAAGCCMGGCFGFWLRVFGFRFSASLSLLRTVLLRFSFSARVLFPFGFPPVQHVPTTGAAVVRAAAAACAAGKHRSPALPLQAGADAPGRAAAVVRAGAPLASSNPYSPPLPAGQAWQHSQQQPLRRLCAEPSAAEGVSTRRVAPGKGGAWGGERRAGKGWTSAWQCPCCRPGTCAVCRTCALPRPWPLGRTPNDPPGPPLCKGGA